MDKFLTHDNLLHSIWTSAVRDYEIDFQGILNNACYFQYLAQARALHFSHLGIDIVKWSKEGINAVLIESTTKFLKSLKYKDTFQVITEVARISRFKLLFHQKIIKLEANDICVVSKNICCVLSKENKPFFPDILSKMEIVKE